jgi:hypothetical protein
MLYYCERTKLFFQYSQEKEEITQPQIHASRPSNHPSGHNNSPKFLFGASQFTQPPNRHSPNSTDQASCLGPSHSYITALSLGPHPHPPSTVCTAATSSPPNSLIYASMHLHTPPPLSTVSLGAASWPQFEQLETTQRVRLKSRSSVF